MEEKRIDISPVENRAEAAAKLLKAIANDKRLMILCKLIEGEKSVSELLEHVGVSQSALSQHLSYLRENKIVKSRKEGQKVLYSLYGREARDLMSVLCEIFKE
jgi:ArsR family transcriptional regulator